MWLRMGLDNTKMADNVSFIVKVLRGSFSVNVFLDKTKYFIANPVAIII